MPTIQDKLQNNYQCKKTLGRALIKKIDSEFACGYRYRSQILLVSPIDPYFKLFFTRSRLYSAGRELLGNLVFIPVMDRGPITLKKN